MDKKIYAGIHTVQIRTPQMNQKDGVPFINSMHISHPYKKTTKTIFNYTLNPNKHDYGTIYEYSVFNKAMGEMLDTMEIDDYIFKRVDFCFDSYEDDYDKMKKLNKTLLMLVAISRNITNVYESINPISLDHLTLRIQNTSFEGEYYHRTMKDPESKVKSRLELRCKAPKDKPIPMLLHNWIAILKTALGRYNTLTDAYNAGLIRQWTQECTSKRANKNQFIRYHQDNILTRPQLASFYMHTGQSRALKAADNYVNKYGMNYVSLNMVKDYVYRLEKAAENYLNS